MCSCKFKVGAKKSLSGYDTYIPADEFAKGSTKKIFEFYHCVGGNDTINKALSVIQVKPGDPLTISSVNDMAILADMSDTGNDVKMFGKSIKQILESIQFTPEQLQNASCKVAFATT